ncbi:hypothetical protein [Streptomyces rimosus]|uniref:hypothetical protein n=1 Tax=Streptomyces rimosus TaxID=1927 RepID=UPI000B01DF85|nr:hypothetical protein [Streptomyces rimosus]
MKVLTVTFRAQVQLGEENFRKFLDYIKERLVDVGTVETTYLTRAWAARRAD